MLRREATDSRNIFRRKTHIDAKHEFFRRPLAIVVKKPYNVLNFVFEDQDVKFRRNGEKRNGRSKKSELRQ